MIPCRLDTVQLTQEKEKSSVAQSSTGWFKKIFLECGSPTEKPDFTEESNSYLKAEIGITRGHFNN